MYSIAHSFALVGAALSPETTQQQLVFPQNFSSTYEAISFVKAQSELMGIYPPHVALTIDRAIVISASTTNFYTARLPDPDGEIRSHWLVRRMASQGRTVSVQYADTRQCPAIIDVLTAAEQVERPVVDIDRIPVDHPPVELNGDELIQDSRFELKTRGYFASNMTRAQTAFSGGNMSPVAAWANQVDQALEPCWGDQPPEWAVPRQRGASSP